VFHAANAITLRERRRAAVSKTAGNDFEMQVKIGTLGSLANMRKTPTLQILSLSALVLAHFICAQICSAQQTALPQCPIFAGTPQLSAACISSIADIAFDSTGAAWVVDNTGFTPGRVLRFPGIRSGQLPPFANLVPDLVLGKPDFQSLNNGACVACSLDRPFKLLFDSSGALWVSDLPAGGRLGVPAKVHRFSPPFSNGQQADLIINGPDGSGGMKFDSSGNLWVAGAFSCGAVLEYSRPFTANMQPSVILGQSSLATCTTTPGPNVLNGVQGLAFGSDGSLFVGDTASDRVAVFRPPFSTFMNPALVIGQSNLTNYLPIPVEAGGFGGIADLTLDPSGKLLVLSGNYQHVSVYSPPFSIGMAKDAWFNFIARQTSNGTAFPFTFNGYASLRLTADSSLWFAASGVAAGLGTFAVLPASILQPLEVGAVPVVLPQFVFGGAWYSALYFTNTGEVPVTFGVSLVADSGASLFVPALGASSVNISLPPHGTAMVEAPNSGPLVQGYAKVLLPAAVKGYGVFRQSVPGINDQEAVVPFSSTTSGSSTLVWDESNFVSGVALVNLSTQNTAVSVIARDLSGTVIGTTAVAVPALGKTAFALRDLPGMGAVVGKRGSADFTVTTGSIAVLGLRFYGAAFTSIPPAQR
jgi:hypothetical protein